jgi:hypothetical protein
MAFLLDPSPQPTRADRTDDREDQQRAQAELKPAAFAFRRVGFGQFGSHGRIIPDRRQPEQEDSPHTRIPTVFGSACRGRKCGFADQRIRLNKIMAAAMLSADAATWR